MDITVGLFLLFFGMAFVCEFIDSSLGMGYGTILAPVLLIMGIPPLTAVPALLLSQAFGGLTASVFHQRFENVSFKKGSKDLSIVAIISGFGILATIFAALLALSVPKVVLKTYIGVLVLAMGFVLLSNWKFEFSWKKMIGVGVLSAFNKGLSGGGFGPVVTAGQIISGQEQKGAIGATTLAEAPICLVGFITYAVGKGMAAATEPLLEMPVSKFLSLMFGPKVFQWELVLALLLGSVCVAPFGAFATKLMRTHRLNQILGMVVVALGVWTLIKTYL